MPDRTTDAHIRSEVEAQYNARAALPEHVQILAHWARASDQFRNSHAPAQLDLAYGDGARERLDLFYADRTDAPTLVYFHGGYWQNGHKNEHSTVASPLVEHGLHVAMVGYDLCPAVTLEAVVGQACRAVSWLWREAGRLDIRRNALWVGGHSAGAHLAAMVLAGSMTANAPLAPPVSLSGAILISGIYDLEPLLSTSMNAALGLNQHRARALSPLFLPAPGRPVLIAVGAEESGAFIAQADALAGAWSAGSPCVRIPGANHFTVLDDLKEPGSGLLRQISATVAP